MLATAELITSAHELAFELVGVCPVQPAPHWDAYSEWVYEGRNAGMKYLKEHLALKQDPRSLLATAKSIVAVGMNYNQPNPALQGFPRIARYALGRDYHKVIRSKLRRLAAWLDETHPGGEHRACVDSAPILERDYANLAGLGWFGKNTMLMR